MAFFASDRERLHAGFAFDRDRAVEHLRQSDARFAALIERVGAFDLELHPVHSTFAALARVIVYQQLSGRAAATIFGRVADLFGGELAMDPDSLASITDEALRAAGLSRSKTAALRDLARLIADGSIPCADELRGCDIETLHTTLTRVRGVGPWSVEMVAIFWLGHADILPTTDLGIKKGFQRLYELEHLPSADDLLRTAEPWRPYRSVASWYLWRAADTALV